MVGSADNTLIDIFLYLVTCLLDIVLMLLRKNNVFVTYGSLRVDDINTYLSSSLISTCILYHAKKKANFKMPNQQEVVCDLKAMLHHIKK